MMVIGVQTDLLFPVWQQREMATVLQEAGQYLPRRATQSLVRPQHHLSGHRITGQAAQSLVGPHHYWSDLTIIGRATLSLVGPHNHWSGHTTTGPRNARKNSLGIFQRISKFLRFGLTYGMVSILSVRETEYKKVNKNTCLVVSQNNLAECCDLCVLHMKTTSNG